MSDVDVEIRLWTLQTPEAWELAKNSGALRGDGRRVPEDMRVPYRWLIGQMRERLPNFKGGYPIWAYPHEKPDLRQRQFNRGTPAVRIEFVAPEKDVLVSHLGAWHAVLSGMYCSLNEADETDFNAGNEFFSVWTDGYDDPERTKAIIESWERIFDLPALGADPEWNGSSWLQATLGQVGMDQVVAVTPFVSR